MAKVAQINIDMEKPCDICGAMGAANSTGLCLECAGKRVADNMRARINPQAYSAIVIAVQKLLVQYDLEINAAYLRTPDLAISFSVKIQESKIPGKLALDVGISFVESRIKDSVVELVNDGRQGDLFK